MKRAILIMSIVIAGLSAFSSSITLQYYNYKKQVEAKNSLINECYMNYKYFVFKYSGMLINKDRTNEQREAFDMLDASVDKLIFTTEEK